MTAEQLRCTSCGGIVGEREGETYTIRHRGREIVITAPERLTIKCDRCGRRMECERKERKK